MRKASALTRLIAPMIAAGVLVSGCGQSTPPPVATAERASGGTTVADNTGTGPAASRSPETTPEAPAGAPGEPVAAGPVPTTELVPAVTPASLPPGSIYRNPANGRDEVIVADIRHTALLIGDSQSEPTLGWPRRGLSAIGYKVHFCGLGGTGFVAANGETGNYIDALQRGDWKLPYGSPPLVVIQGGGNDAARGATDAQIAGNADRLIVALKQRYPGAKLALIGTLARGANHGGGRRTQVDALLGTVAAKHAIPFVSVGDWLTRYDLAKDLADGVHMNATGHKALGALLGTRLKELGLGAETDSRLNSLVR